jgi:hypothetical protein
MYSNFGDLYRAAFSEANPERKQRLLADVKEILDNWAASEDQRSSASSAARKNSARFEAHERMSRSAA